MEQNRSAGRVSPVVSVQRACDDALDVLEEDKLGLAALDALQKGGKKMAGVAVRISTPGGAERLEGVGDNTVSDEAVVFVYANIPDISLFRSG